MRIKKRGAVANHNTHPGGAKLIKLNLYTTRGGYYDLITIVNIEYDDDENYRTYQRATQRKLNSSCERLVQKNKFRSAAISKQ